jgi:hypothetical protein
VTCYGKALTLPFVFRGTGFDPFVVAVVLLSITKKTGVSSVLLI